MVAGGQPGDSRKVNLLANPQTGSHVTRVTAEGTRVDPRIEAAEGSNAIPDPRQNGKRVGHLEPEETLFGSGHDGVFRRVDIHTRRPSASSVGNQVPGIVVGAGTPRLVGHTEQVATAPDAGNPSISQQITAAAHIDGRTGRRDHIACRQGHRTLGQSTRGDVHPTRIDPRQAIGCQSEGNGQSVGRDRRRGGSPQNQIRGGRQGRGCAGHGIGRSGP